MVRPRSRRHRKQFGHIADKNAGEIEYMSCLLDHLPARLALTAPPGGWGRTVEPISEREPSRVLRQDCLRFLCCVEIAPMIAHGRDKAGIFDRACDPFTHGEIGSNGLLDKKGYVLF